MDIPGLPAGLVPVRLERAASARDAAIDRARDGAEEGTLVVVDGPAAPRDRHGDTWLTPAEPGLDAALVLRPGLPSSECAELGPVALVAIGSAVAGVVEPMTELHYGWPNDLLLDHGKAGSVGLDGAGTPEAIDWLVIAWRLNVHASPEALGHGGAAIAVEGGAADVDRDDLMGAIGRELVAAIATWDESGFDATLRRLRQRIVHDRSVDIRLADGTTVTGAIEDIDDRGALTLRTDAGSRTLSLDQFFGLPTEAR